MALTVQDVDLYVEERGSGAPVLFLHGAPDAAELWNGVIERLQDDYHCIAPDLPGFGRSHAPKDFTCSLENMAKFLDTFIEEAHIPTPLKLVVTDFGATYGLSWAASHPDKVERLAIVGGSNFSSRYHWHAFARILRTPLLGELAMSTVTVSSQQQMMQRMAPLVSSEYVRQAYTLSLARWETRRMMLKLYRGINASDFVGREENLRNLTTRIPTLVLWGDKDPFITPDFAEQFAGAQIEHFAENGHWLAIEAPEQVAQRLATFFA